MRRVMTALLPGCLRKKVAPQIYVVLDWLDELERKLPLEE